MKNLSENLLLYCITDRKAAAGRDLLTLVREAIEGGATMIQLREKDFDDDSMLTEAGEMVKLCRHKNIPLIINDRVDVALLSGADGVHLGQEDLEASQARKKLGPDKILGITAQNVDQAKKAEAEGADYLGVGAVFKTNSKDDAIPISLEELKEICEAVSIPVVAIGGVDEKTIDQLKDSGIAGVSVIQSVFGSDDVYLAAKRMREKAEEVISND